MAAPPPHVTIVPNTPLSNRYSDSYTNGHTRPPGGPCNYTNLNIGGNPKCGCLRFTDKSLDHHDYSAPTRQGLCICEHHSCFHNHEPVDGYPAASSLSATVKQSALTHAQAQARDEATGVEPQVGQPFKENSLSDTLQWSRFMKSGSSMGSLPAIPSQCLLPSENGSRASSSQTGYTRPFGGRGLDTLSHIPKSHAGCSISLAPLGKGRVIGENGKIMQIYEDSNGQGHLQSVTEVATPSMRSSQDLDAEIAFTKNVRTVQESLHRLAERNPGDADDLMTLCPSEGSPDEMQSVKFQNDSNDEHILPKIRSILNHVANYPEMKRNHENRLDQLENASFTNGPLEDLRNDHELLETRVMELEVKLENVEKEQQARAETSSVGSHHMVNASMDSRSSSALIASAIDHLDYSRIEALESQILELQAAAPPTYSRPWEVEVVFLPFGPRLMGIWSSQLSMSQRSRINSGSGDEWTQTQQQNSMAAAQARLTSHGQPVSWEASAADLSDQQTPWLMAKACALQSRVDERLRSRGLVKTIYIKGPDARDVQLAMLESFGDLPGILADDPYSHHDHKSTDPHELCTHLGLQSPWIPLRKVHKNSYLRFLNTSEMITPALWTVNFLSSSVVMRASGTRRLFVTHNDSYIQHLGSTASWTWQKLRQLDRVYPDVSVGHTPEADAYEPCWDFDERYDTPPSLSSSISSHHSLTIRSVVARPEPEPTSPSDHFSSAGVSPAASTTPTSLLAQALPLCPFKERHPFRPLHTRTTSMPSLIPIKPSPSQLSKRRIASFDHESQSSLTRAPSAVHLRKRYRTRSPSRPRDTPRWSVGPPSPYPFEDFERKRGTTPFAYATPHSNGPYIDNRISGELPGVDDEDRGSTTDDSELDGGDRNALSDYGDEGQAEDVWEGLQDEPEYESQSAGKSLKHDDEESDGCPSEYPSTQPPEAGNTTAGFRIHVDVDEEASNNTTRRDEAKL